MPSGLVWKSRSGVEHFAVVLRSDGRRFKVIGISGPALIDSLEFPTDAAEVQKLQLTLDPSKAPSGTSDIRIATDLPEQPAVLLSVLVLPNEGGAEP